MTFDLSLIVPHRNHVKLLPRLLDSVLAQKGVKLEVIVVDDNSIESPTTVLDAYRSQGLHIVLLTNAKQIFTKNARLDGVVAAHAPLVAFADADDTLVGTDILAQNILQMRETNADILHFRSYFASSEKGLENYYFLADPFALQLEGHAIYEAALKQNIGTNVLWNKLFRKDLFKRFLPVAYASKVRRYIEDTLINHLAYMHAQLYVGSDKAGYAYYYEPKDLQDSAERAVYSWYMRSELKKHLEELGFSQAIQDLFVHNIEHYLSLCIGRLSLAIGKKEGHFISESTVDELLTQVDTKTFIQTLLLGCQINAHKLVQAVQLLKTGKLN